MTPLTADYLSKLTTPIDGHWMFRRNNGHSTLSLLVKKNSPHHRAGFYAWIAIDGSVFPGSLFAIGEISQEKLTEVCEALELKPSPPAANQ